MQKQFPSLSAFVLEQETQSRPMNFNRVVSQGCQSEATVMSRIIFIAHSDKCLLEQGYRGRQDLLAAKTLSSEISFKPATCFGDAIHQALDVVKFVFLAYFGKSGVITLLLSTFLVPPGCGQMAVFKWGNPRFLPSRRNCKLANPIQNGAMMNTLPCGILIVEVAGPAMTTEPGRALIVDTAQTGNPRGTPSLGLPQIVLND